MIPAGLKKEHILAALQDIDLNSFPNNRKARKFVLYHEGKEYPPKVVITTATKIAFGKDLDVENFSGGDESNNFLRKLGFKIVQTKGETINKSAKTKKIANTSQIPAIDNKKIKKSDNATSAKNFKIGRIMINKGEARDPGKAQAMLESALMAWPEDTTVDYLMTCGGFTFQEGSCKNLLKGFSEDEIVSDMKNAAISSMKSLVKSEAIQTCLRKVTKYFFAGMDFRLEDSDGTVKSIEFVMALDMKTNKILITGKSYPTMNQQKVLLKFNDHKSHFMNLNGEKVMVLGCHDLNVFNPRTISEAGGWRKEIIEKFAKLAKQEKPTIVLQHPHTSDTPGTWRNTWINLQKLLPSVKEFAGSGAYYSEGEENRGSLEDCLAYTATNDVLNVIVSGKKPYKTTFKQNQAKFKFLESIS